MRRVPLTKGLFALVDDGDFELASAFRWQALRHGRVTHAIRTQKQLGVKRTIYMHRWLLGARRGVEVDHRNGDGLDNRRGNLRLCTHAQNAVNWKRSSATKSSRFHGVCWNGRRARWRVVICAGRRPKGPAKQIYIGVFRAEEDAARAYDRAALKRHGQFAVTNFPREDYV